MKNTGNFTPERITSWSAPNMNDLSKFGDLLAQEIGADGISVVACADSIDGARWMIMDGKRPLSAPYTKDQLVIAIAAYRFGFRTGRQS